MAIVATAMATSLHALVPAPTASAQATCGTTLPLNASLTVSPGQISASATTPVTVTASSYLTGKYVCGTQRFGGVYVFFGWVAPGGQWGPSHRSSTSSNGQFGITYSYPGEGGGGETRDDGSGVVRLVSFTPGGTSGNETPFHMDANGNWSTTINVRGALYSWTDISTGATNTVDCRTVQCGILTVGAHGLSSRTNEQFAPLTFRSDGPPPTIAPGGVTAAPSGTTAASAAPRPAGATTGAATGGTNAPSAAAGTGTATDPGADPGVASPPTVAPSAAPEDTENAAGTDAAAEAATERRIVAGEVAPVRNFHGSGSGGLATLLVVLAAVVVVASTTGWLVRRNRRQVSGGG